jgi:hypothetical protein
MSTKLIVLAVSVPGEIIEMPPLPVPEELDVRLIEPAVMLVVNKIDPEPFESAAANTLKALRTLFGPAIVTKPILLKLTPPPEELAVKLLRSRPFVTNASPIDKMPNVEALVRIGELLLKPTLPDDATRNTAGATSSPVPGKWIMLLAAVS